MDNLPLLPKYLARMQRQGPGGAPDGPRRGGGDLGQMISRLPAMKFEELIKGYSRDGRNNGGSLIDRRHGDHTR